MLRCSFCIIPYVRPQLASRPVEHILDEVRRLVDRGYREVVLTGIHLGHYGVDWNRNAPKERVDAAVAPGAADRRAAGRLPRAALEHRGDRSDARADRRDGRPSATRSRRTCTSRCKAAATACCGGCGAAGAASGSSTAAGWCRSGSTGRRSRPTSSSASPARPTPSLRKRSTRPAPSASRRSTSSRSARAAARRRPRCRTRCRSTCSRSARASWRPSKRNCATPYYRSLIGRRLRVLVETQDERTHWIGTSCRYATVELPASDGRRRAIRRRRGRRSSRRTHRRPLIPAGCSARYFRPV